MGLILITMAVIPLGLLLIIVGGDSANDPNAPLDADPSDTSEFSENANLRPPLNLAGARAIGVVLVILGLGLGFLVLLIASAPGP